MGDTGSLILGYAIAYLALKYAMNNPSIFPYRQEALLWPYTVLIVPTFDVARVTLGRLARRAPVFKADKTHIHHKIMQAGFSMHQALYIILSLFVFYCLLNTVLIDISQSYNLLVVVDVLSYAAFFAMLRAVAKGTKNVPAAEAIHKGAIVSETAKATDAHADHPGKTVGRQ